jgi:hypothetical protein
MTLRECFEEIVRRGPAFLLRYGKLVIPSVGLIACFEGHPCPQSRALLDIPATLTWFNLDGTEMGDAQDGAPIGVVSVSKRVAVINQAPIYRTVPRDGQ